MTISDFLNQGRGGLGGGNARYSGLNIKKDRMYAHMGLIKVTARGAKFKNLVTSV